MCAEYDLYARGFGWSDTVISGFIHHADGGYDIGLNPAPAGSLTITISDLAGSPVNAEIILLRSDGSIVGYALGDNLAVGRLPHFDYNLLVSSREFAVSRSTISLLSADSTVEIRLSPAYANVLLSSISDDSAADAFETHLFAMGLTVRRVDYLPPLDSLWQYELVIYSAGGSSDSAVCSPHVGGSLLDCRRAGIKLLIEGGELAYEYHDAGNTPVLDSLLMISGWHGDDPGTGGLTLVIDPETAYPLAHNPDTPPRNIITRTINPMWDYEYFDNVVPGASSVLYYPGTASWGTVTYYADSACAGAHRIAHFFFKYDDALTTPNANRMVLSNAVEWLRPPDFEHGVLLAKAWVPGGESGDIDVFGGGDSTVTQADGRFRLQFVPGTYSIDFSAPHIVDTTFVGITLAPAEVRSGDIFVLRVFGDIGEIPKPDEFALTGVYPNPFNGRVAFDIQAPGECEVLLRIFDINGRIVHSRKREFSGSASMIWDTGSGISLPSGIYFYRLSVRDREFSGKVLLVK